MRVELLSIDPQAGLPAYQQIARHFASEIRSGALARGARLPAIRSLAAQLGLHRDTVALAYEQLSNQGWVEAQVGRGTFVRAKGLSAAPIAESAGVSGAEPGSSLASVGHEWLILTGGELILVDKKERRVRKIVRFEGAAMQHGLAIAHGRIFVVLDDGRVLCFGG